MAVIIVSTHSRESPSSVGIYLTRVRRQEQAETATLISSDISDIRQTENASPTCSDKPLPDSSSFTNHIVRELKYILPLNRIVRSPNFGHDHMQEIKLIYLNATHLACPAGSLLQEFMIKSPILCDKLSYSSISSGSRVKFCFSAHRKITEPTRCCASTRGHGSSRS